MTLEDPLSEPAVMTGIGWPWHGRLERLADAGQINRLVMPTRTITNGDPVSGNPADGNWVIRVESSSNYLWAPPGRADEPDEMIEAQGGAWWGRAILRPPGVVAYGALPVASFSGGPVVTWPVWFDDKKGQAALFGFPGSWTVRICEDDTLGEGEPLAYTVAVADIDWEQGSPPVYINGAQSNQFGLGSLVDISRDGRSVLFDIRSSGNTGTQFGTMTTGLLRLNITGVAGARTASWVLVCGRSASVGVLSSDDTGSLELEALAIAPMELVQQGGTPPACASTIYRAPGQLVPATGEPGEGDLFQGRIGSATRTVRRDNALVAAWFDEAGDVAEVRFDLHIIQSVTNSRQDNCSGLREQIDTYSSTGTACESTGSTTTDTRILNVTGVIEDRQEYLLTMRGPGALVETVNIVVDIHIDCEWDANDYFAVVGTRAINISVGGDQVVSYADDTMPTDALGLAPGSPVLFGTPLQALPLTHDTSTERPVVNTVPAGFSGQIGVMVASNHAVTLASLWRQGLSAWTIQSGRYATPSGGVGEPLSSAITFAPVPGQSPGLGSGEAIRFARASHNPVTGELARAWPDKSFVNWV